MPRYWVIAPFENNERYESAWQFDLTNNCISIGWEALGEVSQLGREELLGRVAEVYPQRSSQSHRKIRDMV